MDSKHQLQNPKQKHKIATTNMRRSQSNNSDSKSHMESPHSPLRFHSPLRSDLGDPPESPPYSSPLASPEKPPENSRAIVAVDKFTQFSPLPSPMPQHGKTAQPPDGVQTPVVMFNRTMREEPLPGVAKVGPTAVAGVGEDGRPRAVSSVLQRSKREKRVMQAALVFRLCEVVLCLISFSVMAADRTQGWSGDSFDRYKEYRYCLSVNVIAFVYSGLQAYDLAYHFITRKYLIRHHLRCYFAFFMDQVLAYLLISASSSAATRVDDWQSNWGKDEFTVMASASVAMSFLAFAAFALSSLISGYDLCTQDLA